jgi:hypothetical protein
MGKRSRPAAEIYFIRKRKGHEWRNGFMDILQRASDVWLGAVCL